MGLWDNFAVLPASAQGLSAELAVLSTHSGWQYVRLLDDAETGQTVSALSTSHSVPVIGAFVWDSDVAAVFFSAPSGESGWLAINPPYDDEHDAETQHGARWANPDVRLEAAEALARWATDHAPRKPAASEIVAGLTDLLYDDPSAAEDEPPAILMAEDGVRFIFEDMLGFANLDAAVFFVESGSAPP